MSLIEVYKTSVIDLGTSAAIIAEIHSNFPGSKANFDLEDCDCILRIESQVDIFDEVPPIVKAKGYLCEILE